MIICCRKGVTESRKPGYFVLMRKTISVFYWQLDELISNSFLSEKIKRQYRLLYQTKRNRLADMKL